MPESVKISELTARTAVDTDLVPAVDSTFTQTVRVSAASIAAIGGGPPGNSTVTTAKLVDGAVTYPKIQNVSATDRILGRATAGAGVVEEIPCSPLARSVLAATTSSAMCAAMGALNSTVEANFTGPVRFADGTASAPSITNNGDTNTGIYFPLANVVGITADGYERLRIAEDGSQYSNFPGTLVSTELRPQWPVRAWVNFNGTAAGSFTIANQHTICQRYTGFVGGSLRDDTATRAKIADLEDDAGTQSITAYSQVGTENRTNYTTPSDNFHYFWNGSQWATTPATGQPWIGSITITNTVGVQIRSSGNIQSVVRNNTGLYTVNFVGAMPDPNYSVVGNCNAASGGAPGVVRIQSIAASSVQIYTANTTAANSVFDASTVCLAVIR